MEGCLPEARCELWRSLVGINGWFGGYSGLGEEGESAYKAAFV